MQQWGFYFGEEDEIKVKQIMAILNCDDYEKVKAFYLKTAVKNKNK